MLCLKHLTSCSVVWLCHSLCTLFAEENIAAVTVSPETQRVKENGVASFLCHLSADIGNFRISWFKSDRLISEKNPKYMIVGMHRGSVLRVVPARKRDEGIYECRASDDQHTSSATGQLGIYAEGRAPPGFPAIRDLPTKVIEKNHNDVLQCLVTGEPTPTISWLKDFLPINATNPRIRSIPGGKLQIQRAQELDMGKYECVATNSLGVTHSNLAYVYVKERQVPPQFSRPPESVEVMPGGAVNLTCVAIGSPMPYVKWLHGPVELTPVGSPPPIGLNVLKLKGVVESTTYTCEASSALGIITAQAEVRLKDLPEPPVDVVAAEVTSDSVTLSWNSGNDDVTESYIIRYNRLNTPGNGSNVQVTDVTDTEYTVSDLVPFTAYSFQVMAVNSIGTSAPSAVLEATTHESIPGTAPLNVRARPVSSSTVVVQWDEPLRPNGLIKGYRVYYSLKLDVPLSLWMSVEVDNSLVTTISNLYTNRSYGVRALAFTNVGNGPPSDMITVITHQGVPEQPGNVRGTPLSATSIKLAWEPSDAFSKNFDSYKIFGVDVVRRRNFTFSVLPSQTSYVVEGLSPNTRYSFRVAAKSLRGMGPVSAQTEVSTLESAPSAAPQKVEGEAIDSTSIRVRWSPPKERDQNGVITGYRVRYGVASEDAVVVSVLPTETAYVVTNLRKWTPYRIAVLAHTEFGDGPYSDTVTVSTAEDGTMGDIVMESNQCPVCEKVLAKSGSRYHLVRHMKAKHGIEDPESMLDMAIGSEDKKKKGPNLKTTPRKCKVPLISAGSKNGKRISKSIGLCITASDAKNELIAEGGSGVKEKKKESGGKSTYQGSTLQPENAVRSADGPRKPTRPQLFVPKFKDINQREAEFVTQMQKRAQGLRIIKKNVGKDVGVQTGMKWDETITEIEYCNRICKTLCELKTAEELFKIETAECPNLDCDILVSIIKSHYPRGQVLNVGIPIEERKELDGRLPSTSTKVEGIGKKSSEEYSTILEEDLRLSDSDDDDSSLVIVYSSSEEVED